MMQNSLLSLALSQAQKPSWWGSADANENRAGTRRPRGVGKENRAAVLGAIDLECKERPEDKKGATVARISEITKLPKYTVHVTTAKLEFDGKIIPGEKRGRAATWLRAPEKAAETILN